MTIDTRFSCLPTAIGSMPHRAAKEAYQFVISRLPDVPMWPQLPRRDFTENMYVQFSEGFPGIAIQGDKPIVDREEGFVMSLEALYTAEASNDIKHHWISAECAAGLHALLSSGERFPAVKGQMTGPITWGLCVADQNGQPIIYDDVMADAVIKHLRLKARWQENALHRVSNNTIIFVDEPYLTSLSSFPAITSNQVTSSLKSVLSAIQGIKGIHCCGSTDWTLLLEVRPDVLSFDAYNYADSLALYPGQVEDFVKGGGAIAWGIVPNDEECLSKETVYSLKDRLEEAMVPYTRNGLHFKQLVEQSLLTPSCGLAHLPIEGAELALELLAEVSVKMREHHGS